jgi:ferric iron reductase protein FhuF
VDWGGQPEKPCLVRICCQQTRLGGWAASCTRCPHGCSSA